MITIFRQLLSDRQGATAVEYGLIGGILAVAIIAGFGAMTEKLSLVFEALKNDLAAR